MNAPRKSITDIYLYDPLDRLTGAHSAQRFYNGTRIATEIQNNRKTCFFEHEGMPLAELHPAEAVTLLATDQQRSVLYGVSPVLSQPQSYGPYGYRPTTNGLLNLLGFNGERPDSATGHYLLGQGYRAFNPVLMRFNSPDKLSPFDKGGINSYAYCGGDPLNRKDSTGHTWAPLKSLLRKVGLMKKAKPRLPEGAVSKVGYHGTTSAGERQLIAHGPKEGHAGQNSSLAQLKHGEGFYISQQYDDAKMYAESHLTNRFKAISEASVVEVHIKNIQKKVLDQDYYIGSGVDEGMVVFYPSTYSDITIKPYRTITRNGSITSSSISKVIQTVRST